MATIRDESRVTVTGLIVGSPSYMAPEQATAGDVTAATDLWALGALLYFMVEGEPPFLGARPWRPPPRWSTIHRGPTSGRAR